MPPKGWKKEGAKVIKEKTHPLDGLFHGGLDLEAKGHSQEMAIEAMRKEFRRVRQPFARTPRREEMIQSIENHDQHAYLGSDYIEWKEALKAEGE